MAKIAISGDDTLILNGRIFSDFATEDISMLDFDDDIMTSETGKNANAVFSRNNAGFKSTLELRLLLASGDDIFINSILNQQVKDLSAFRTIGGEYKKRISDGKGTTSSVSYLFEGGYVSKIPLSKSNVSGDVSQSIVVWSIKFSKTTRTIG